METAFKTIEEEIDYFTEHKSNLAAERFENEPKTTKYIKLTLAIKEAERHIAMLTVIREQEKWSDKIETLEEGITVGGFKKSIQHPMLCRLCQSPFLGLR